MNKTVIFAALAATSIAAPAFAQATPTPVGPRLEAIAGYDVVKSDGSKEDGALFGLGVGYDVAVSQGVTVGADAEASLSSVKDEFLPGEEIKAGRDLYAGGRVSFAVADNANIYVKGGYTNAKVKYDGSLGNDSTNLDGYRLGLGTQIGLGGKAYAGAEYRYSNYEEGVTRNQLVATVGTRF